jgi:hypothetical protein
LSASSGRAKDLPTDPKFSGGRLDRGTSYAAAYREIFFASDAGHRRQIALVELLPKEAPSEAAG